MFCSDEQRGSTKRYLGMEPVKNSTLLIALLILLAGLASAYNWMIGVGLIVLALPIIVLRMVYRTLTDKWESKHHFEDRFYEDWEYQRVRVNNDSNHPPR